MIDPHAARFADRACHERVTIEQNMQIARDTFRLRFSSPALARSIVPGQFLMLRLAGFDDPLLGRPLALYDTVVDERGSPSGMDVVYLVQGKLTTRLARAGEGTGLDVWGPLGNGFEPQETDHLVMVAGGIGQTPFVALAREHLGGRRYGAPPRSVSRVPRVTLCYGARNQGYLAGVDDFKRLGVEVRTSTDDGSAGHHGLVTELLQQVLDESPDVRVVCCGPEKMMERVSEITHSRRVPCQVSLETPMACGVGICFSCVARVRQADGTWDYRRTCVEGPVFDATQIEW
jgi:dihydroorotate dehydrogenase electron transfer subunit